jgi:phospholipid/cholesterol/gamma-HCH transport system substrate-binding protein
MKPIYQWDKYRVGLIGIGVLAFVSALVIGVSQMNLGARGYTVMLEHSAGIRTGEAVQVAGVDVGKVTGIELDGDEVKVSFTVDDDVRLGKETTVEVKVATLLGTHYLMVSPHGSGDIGDAAIPVSRSRVPYNLQDVIEEGTVSVNEYDTKLLEKSLGEIATVLKQTGGEIKPALEGVGKLSNLIADRSDDVGRLLTAANSVTKQLNASTGDILALMKASDLILDTLRTRRATIHALLADLTDLGRQLNGAVNDIKADIGPTLRDLNTAIVTLKSHEKSLGRSVEALTLAGRYLANTTGGGPWANLYANGSLPNNLTCARGILC